MTERRFIVITDPPISHEVADILESIVRSRMNNRHFCACAVNGAMALKGMPLNAGFAAVLQDSLNEAERKLASLQRAFANDERQQEEQRRAQLLNIAKQLGLPTA